uniref:Uncharacterized protein n=1 Tax=Hyaloperonospora arabidopsidis (strain Emoy2) TaxID=559515 RepID=M4BF85_HYAAE
MTQSHCCLSFNLSTTITQRLRLLFDCTMRCKKVAAFLSPLSLRSVDWLATCRSTHVLLKPILGANGESLHAGTSKSYRSLSKSVRE